MGFLGKGKTPLIILLVLVVGYYNIKGMVTSAKIERLDATVALVTSERESYRLAFDIVEGSADITDDETGKLATYLETLRTQHTVKLEELNHEALDVEDYDGTVIDVFNIMFNGMYKSYCTATGEGVGCTE